MSDLISRQAAINAVKHAWAKGLEPTQYIEAIPPAERWIPVEEGLPKEHDSIFARFKGTDRWKSNMWEKRSDYVLVTIMFENGYTAVDIASTHDGKWFFDQYSVALRRRKVIAWRQFPAAYKPEEV